MKEREKKSHIQVEQVQFVRYALQSLCTKLIEYTCAFRLKMLLSPPVLSEAWYGLGLLGLCITERVIFFAGDERLILNMTQYQHILSLAQRLFITSSQGVF